MANNLKLSTDKKSFLDVVKKMFRRRASLDARKARAGYVFVLPFIIGVILIYLPILIDSIWFSFSDFKIIQGDNSGRLVLIPVGFENYTTPFNTSGFTEALLSGLQQLLFEVPAIIVFSLFIAVVLNHKMLGRAIFRAIFFVPVIISTGIMMDYASGTASGAVGGDVSTGASGGASEIISVLDVQQLFSNMKIGTELVGYVVGIVNNVYNIINYSGVQMLIFLAGLQSISPSIYEACQIEGATGWETFWKITFPMISPMILVNAVYTVIDSFTRTNNPAMSYIQKVYGSGELTMATAMYWMYFLIIALIIVIVAAIASSFVFYQRRD